MDAAGATRLLIRPATAVVNLLPSGINYNPGFCSMPPRIDQSISARLAAVTFIDEPTDGGTATSPRTPDSTGSSGPGGLAAPRAPKRPRSPPAQSGFDDVGIDLIERFSDAFAFGSKDVSRLCTISRTFRGALADRAFTDKLCTQAAAPLAHSHVSEAFEQLIAQSVGLPPQLHAEVLLAVMQNLPKHLHSPLAGLDGLLNTLLHAAQANRDPRQRYKLHLTLGTMFRNRSFRSQCFEADNVMMLKPAMADFYRSFTAATKAVLPVCVAASDQACRAAAPIDIASRGPTLLSHEARKLHVEMSRVLTGGLFMIDDPENRYQAWISMHQNPLCGSGAERLELLKGLSDALVFLTDATHRRCAFAKILGDVERLPIEAQPEMIRRLAGRLNVFDADSVFIVSIGRLCSLATALPADKAHRSMCDIMRTFPEILPIYRREFAFNSFVETIRRQSPAQQARMLPTLASRIYCLASDLVCAFAFDTIWSELQALDAPLRVATVCRLVSELDALPRDTDLRQVRFADAIDFAYSIAPELRFDLILRMAERVDSLVVPSLQMSAFHDVLDLVSTQSLSDQVTLLKEMHNDFNFENYDSEGDDPTRFAMTRALARAAARMPPENHAEMLVSFADAAVWLRNPFMARQLRSVVAAAKHLPEQLCLAMLAHVSDTLERRVGQIRILPGEEIPSCFSDVLATADQLPTAMRLQLLQAVVATASQFPAAHKSAALSEIRLHLHGLPNQAVTDLVLAFGPGVQ